MKHRVIFAAGFFAVVTLVVSSCHTPEKKSDSIDRRTDRAASIETQAQELAMSSAATTTSDSLRMPSSQSAATCAPCADGGQYEVHLTFDDGPYKNLTEKIVKTLRAKNVEATFFELTSAYSPKQSERNLCNYDDITQTALHAIEKDIHAGGNELACHTLEHIDHVDPAIPLEKAKFNIRRGIELAPKNSVKYLRLPYGRGWYKEKPGSEEARRAGEIMSLIHQLGYKHLGWDIDSFDWAEKYHSHQPQALLADICAMKGGVVLMHDIQPFESATLASTIDAIRCSGHKIVSLKEIEDLNRKRPLVSFQDHANYEVVDCPGGLSEIKTGKCLVKPHLDFK